MIFPEVSDVPGKRERNFGFPGIPGKFPGNIGSTNTDKNATKQSNMLIILAKIFIF